MEMSNILTTIGESMGGLYQKELQLASYIMAYPSETTHLNIVELANRSGTSTATITRFCKSFRFLNFSDFKVKLAAELAAKRSTAPSYQDIVADTHVADLVTNVKQNYIRSITETALILEMDTIEKTVQVLQQARQIDIYGIATSGVVASDFYQKLIRLGRRAVMFTDSHMQITSAATLAEEDVVFAISYSGETPEIIDAVSCAQDRGATAISLTKYGPNTLAHLSDLQLCTSTLEEGIRRGDMASRIAQLFVIDIVFTGMLSTAFDKYIPKLEESYQLVHRYRKTIKGR
jgi:DNA-binding MurR/RpiR family transcriptional regulator